jgi:hypothetical protein
MSFEGNAYRGTSTTSTAVGTGSKTLTVTNSNSQIPAFAVEMTVRIARTSAPSTTFMRGEITAWNSSTGAMTANVDSVKGSGTHTDWTITIGVNITTASSSPLAVANGGTGGADAATARSNLDLDTGDSPTFTAVTAGQVDVTAQGDVWFQDSSGGQYAAFQAPGTISSSHTYTLPSAYHREAQNFFKARPVRPYLGKVLVVRSRLSTMQPQTN